jgi:hypothetical protein
MRDVSVRPRRQSTASFTTLAARPVSRNHGHKFSGKFGAASKPRILSADERRAVEDKMRREGILQ